MLKVRCQNRRQSPVIARGPADRPAQRLVGNDPGSSGGDWGGASTLMRACLARVGAVTRLIARLHRQVDEPAERAGPVTTNEKPPSKRSITSRPEPRCVSWNTGA